jgi:hypothetical protein
MIESVKHVTAKSFSEFPTMPRGKWVVGRCGMAVLCISTVYWTFNSEKALKEEGTVGIAKYLTKCE